MEISAASELLSFIIVIYDIWPTNSFLILFHDCAFGNGRICHLTDVLNDLLCNITNMDKICG